MTPDKSKATRQERLQSEIDDLRAEVETLQHELTEKTQTIDAVQRGEVDAIVVSSNGQEQIFTLSGAEEPYRILFEQMNEGAVTASQDLVILYCNQSFARSMKTPLERIIGTGLENFISPAKRLNFRKLMEKSVTGPARDDMIFNAADGTKVPFQLSINHLRMAEKETYCIVMADLTERIRSEDALRKANEELDIRVQERTKDLSESEAKYHSVFDNIQDPVTIRQMVYDEKGEIVDLITLDANPASVRVRGAKTIDDIKGKRDSTIYRPEMLAKVLDLPRRVKLSNAPATDEMRYDLDDRTYLVTCAPLGGDQVIFTSLDITARRNAEDALRESESRYHGLFDNMAELVTVRKLVYGEKGQVVNRVLVDANPATLRAFGVGSVEGLRGLTDNLILSPEVAAKRLDDIRLMKATGRPITKEVHLDANGRDYLMTSAPLGDDFEITTSVDITERKNAENALRESESKYRGMFEAVQEVFYIDHPLYDPEGNIIDWVFEDMNSAGSELIGLGSAEEARGKRGSKVLGQDIMLFYLPMMEDARRSKKAVKYQYKSPLNDRDILASYVASGDRIMVAQMDVTDIKRAQKEMELYAEKLQRSNTELQQFAYVASHDLQEPLRMVISYLTLLEKRYRDKLDQDGHDFIKYAIDGGKRMKELIDDLLAFSRVDTVSSPFTMVNMNDLVRRTVVLLRVPIEESGATITIESLPTVYGEESQITQVMQNLIANAIKFHGEALPELHVSGKVGDPRVDLRGEG